MTEGRATRREAKLDRGMAGLLLIGALAAVALIALSGGVDLLMPGGGGGDGLSELRGAVNRIKGPATAAFGSVSGLGLLAGGAMAGMGMPQGVRMMTMSGMAGGGVLLGNGLVQ
jgi:hypothetical protein